MQKLGYIVIAGLVGLISTHATAFEQTQVGSDGAPAAAGSATKALQPVIEPSSVPGVQITVPEVSSKPAGTQVRLPVLGVIGTLPKLDFGLELLYGANADSQVKEEPIDPTDDLIIRGTLKHRF